MRTDDLARLLLRPAGWTAIALPALIALFVLREAWPALAGPGLGRFATDPRWAPAAGAYGALPMVATTLASSAAAVAVAGPLGVAFGLWVNLFAPRPLASAARLAAGTLAGVPSVVFGLVALVEVVPCIRAVRPPGLSLLAAVLVLVAMVLPTAAVACDAAVRQVDPLRVTAARALGLSRWDAARAVVLPLAAPGLRTGVLLALGRAIGETMAVLMVAGNTVAWPVDPFAPVRTLTGNVAVEMAYATGLHRSALYATGLALLLLVGALVAVDRSRA